MADIFLSYSRKDEKMMQRVKKSLEAAGISVWTDEGIEPGTSSWKMAIEKAIRDAKALVVLLSPDAAQSRWVREEIGFMGNLNKDIYPVLVRGNEENAIPFGFSEAQWIDLRSGNSFNEGMKSLVHDLEKDVLGPSAKSPAATKKAPSKKSTTPSSLNIPTWAYAALGVVVLAVIGFMFLPTDPPDVPVNDIEDAVSGSIKDDTVDDQVENNSSDTEPNQSTDQNTSPSGVYSPLSDCASSQVYPGDVVFISFHGSSQYIRSSADNGADNVIDSYAEGTILIVLDGVECSNGWLMRQVRVLSEPGGLVGWTAESNGNEFWLAPVSKGAHCPQAPESFLSIYDNAQTSHYPAASTNVRSGPNSSDSVLGLLDPGEQVEIIGGPECNGEFTWWEVRSISTGLTGWTAEGTWGEPWLIFDPR